jgi:hypothetical protein
MYSIDVSQVARACGADAKSDVQGAEQFIATCIPENWEAVSISAGAWSDPQSHPFGAIQHGISLSNFPYWIEDPDDADHIRSIWMDIEDILLKNLNRIPGAKITHDVTSTTVTQPHVWHWSFVYEIEKYKGHLAIWITPERDRKALLIMNLVEFGGTKY